MPKNGFFGSKSSTIAKDWGALNPDPLSPVDGGFDPRTPPPFRLIN